MKCVILVEVFQEVTKKNTYILIFKLAFTLLMKNDHSLKIS